MKVVDLRTYAARAEPAETYRGARAWSAAHAAVPPGGRFPAPRGPALGITVDDDAVRALAGG